MMQYLETFLSILKEPPQFQTQEDEEGCQQVLQQFSGVDGAVEEIAKTSYAYWFVARKAPKELPASARINSALKEIRRHYVGEGRKVDKAVAALRTALEYRREHRMDVLRSCFYEELYDTEEDKILAQTYKTLILEDLKRQPMVVCGVDSHNRTMVYKSPRSSHPAGADKAFFLTQIYTAERAAAMSEFRTAQSDCAEEKLCVIFNFGNYSSSNAPSKSTMITLAKVLQSCYPERLGMLLILDPPFWMRALFNIMWPFLSAVTAEKIQLTSEALPELLEGASDGKQLGNWINEPETATIDVEGYTQQPFCSVDQD
jgi:hypothetical protein